MLWHVRDLMPEGPIRTLFRTVADWLPRRIVAVSGAVADPFAGCRIAALTHTVHDAVDPAQFRPGRPAAAVRAELGLAPDAVVLGMVAHFTRWKGHLVFLDVVAQLLREGAQVAGLFIGGSIYRTAGHPEYEAEVRQHCRMLGLEQHVVFTGYQPCVADYLNAADILVHPPIRPELFGLAFIEAMALGKPVVAAGAGGALEIVEPGTTGILVPPGDADAFARAVWLLLEDRELRSGMGERGRGRVLERFTPEAHVARIERVYQEIAG